MKPVVLRLCDWPTCNDELKVVSQRWWDRFLLSQAVALKIPLTPKEQVLADKIVLDTHPSGSPIISVRGTESNGTLEQETGRGRQHANAAR
jgi:hypothetical protein